MRNTTAKPSTTPANKKADKTHTDSQISDTKSNKSTKSQKDPPTKTANRKTKPKSPPSSVSSSDSEDRKEIEDTEGFNANTPYITSPKTEEFAPLAASFTKKDNKALSEMEIEYTDINIDASKNKTIMSNPADAPRLVLPGGDSSSSGQAPRPPTTNQPINPPLNRGNTPSSVIFSSIQPHIEPIFGTREDINAMKQYLGHLSEDVCTFCGGRGHFPNNCASKRNVDYAMRDTGNGAEWGKVKRKKKEEVYKIKRNIRRDM